ncbi:hypothetical protein L9F63_016182, partial [Diploptera punctata]
YGNVVRLEQLKLYELLVSHSRHQLLVHEPFLRPLLKLLASCVGEVFPLELEKRLVVLLNQLCVSLMQNIELLDLFFYASPDQGSAKFVIFTLLIPFVHREGGIGQQARDALLLCMSLSKKNENVGLYIAEHSNVCPVLATGLSGLYSLLPRKLVIETEDWHRLTPDDINEISELTMFMNSLEFCNAVVQVAHPVVKNQMLEFLYQGFLVPVMGPALLQSTVEELVAATAYFDLFLRSITDPGLLYSFVRFLLEDKYDGERILDSLIQRINTKSRLCLVTLALFETLVDLNCEDVMLELVFRYLVPHSCDVVSEAKSSLFNAYPKCPSSGQSLFGNYHAYLCDARQKIKDSAVACVNWTYRYDGENPPHDAFSMKAIRKGESSGDDRQTDVDLGVSMDMQVQMSAPESKDNDLLERRRLGSTSSIYSRTEDFSNSKSDGWSFSHIGPFLDVILKKLEGMLANSLYVNLHLTGLISRLAVYPQPLLHSFLLNHSLVFQPSIRSLFQTISCPSSVMKLVAQAQDFLVGREDKLVNARKHALVALSPNLNSINSNASSNSGSSIHSNNSSRRSSLSSEPFSRGEPKRRSFSSAFSSVFRRPQTIRENHLESAGSSPGNYRYWNRSVLMSESAEMRNVVMCAVLLDEWLKELAAITQEQAVASLELGLLEVCGLHKKL